MGNETVVHSTRERSLTSPSKEAKPATDGLLSELLTPAPVQTLPSHAKRVRDLDSIVGAFLDPDVNAVLVPTARPKISLLSESLRAALKTQKFDIYESALSGIFRSEESFQSTFLPKGNFYNQDDKEYISQLRGEIMALAEIVQRLAGTRSLRILIANDLGIDPGPHCDPAVAATFKIFGLTTEFFGNDTASFCDIQNIVEYDPAAPLYWPEQDEILVHYGYRPSALPKRKLPFGERTPLVHQAAERWRLEESEGILKRPHSLTVVVSADL